MKSTGIIRRIDDLGRIVIPKEIRTRLHLREGDALEIFVENENVIYSKYNPATSVIDALMSTLNDIKALGGDYDILAIESSFQDIISILGGEK